MSRLTKEHRKQIRALIDEGSLDLDSDVALTDALNTIDAMESELALNQAAIVREAAGVEVKLGLLPSAISHAILAIPTDQPALDRYVAERYITREEHNNIIHMNETVHKRDVTERVQSAYERGVSDGAAARAPIVTKEQLGIVTDDEGNDHWGIQPQPGAPEDGK